MRWISWKGLAGTVSLVVSCAVCGVGPVRAASLPALKGEFFPFAMCMGQMSPAAQVDTARRMGFSSLGLQDTAHSVLQGFIKNAAVASGAFHIRSTLWWTNVTAPNIDTVAFDAFLTDAKKLGLSVWMVLDGNDRTMASKRTAISMAEKAARRCKAKGVPLVIYPHGGCVISSAEQGMELIDSLRARGTTNVRLSIHLCHELKAGNAKRIAAVVAKSISYLDLASISGADSNTVDINDDDWASAIKPLGKGTFDATGFIKALADNGYSGPVELHTYNLKSPDAVGYDHHIEQSLSWWKAHVAPVGTLQLASAGPEPAPMVVAADGTLRISGIGNGAVVRLLDPDGGASRVCRVVDGNGSCGKVQRFGVRVVRVEDGGRSRSMLVVF